MLKAQSQSSPPGYSIKLPRPLLHFIVGWRAPKALLRIACIVTAKTLIKGFVVGAEPWLISVQESLSRQIMGALMSLRLSHWPNDQRYDSKVLEPNACDLPIGVPYRESSLANFYQFTDFTAAMFCKMDRVIFWKLGYWLARKYRIGMRELMRKWVAYPKGGKAKTWRVYGKGHTGRGCGVSLHRMLGNGKKQFRWKTGKGNPYLANVDAAKVFESRYSEVAMAMSQS